MFGNFRNLSFFLMKFANINELWFNLIVKNNNENLKSKIISRYLEKKDNSKNLFKSTDINVLLNRVKANQKNETRKKIYFSVIASTGLLLFGIAIF